MKADPAMNFGVNRFGEILPAGGMEGAGGSAGKAVTRRLANTL